jgi:hypothetical protein
MDWSPCLMSKYTLLVTFGPRAASADCAPKMAANDTTARMRDVLTNIMLGEESEERKEYSSDGDERSFKGQPTRESPKTQRPAALNF